MDFLEQKLHGSFVKRKTIILYMIVDVLALLLDCNCPLMEMCLHNLSYMDGDIYLL